MLTFYTSLKLHVHLNKAKVRMSLVQKAHHHLCVCIIITLPGINATIRNKYYTFSMVSHKWLHTDEFSKGKLIKTGYARILGGNIWEKNIHI